jgi:hypothetical protein
MGTRGGAVRHTALKCQGYPSFRRQNSGLNGVNRIQKAAGASLTEQAHDKAANRAAEAARQVAEQINATRKVEARLADVENALKLAKAEPRLYYAEAQEGISSAQLQQGSSSH